MEWELCGKALQHGDSDGAAVFDYGNRQCYPAKCGKWNRLRCGGSGYSRK